MVIYFHLVDNRNSDDNNNNNYDICMLCYSALRIKLGLKPLDLNTKKPDEEKESLKDDIHKPAVNIGEQKKSEKLRDRLAIAKQKRLQNQKLG